MNRDRKISIAKFAVVLSVLPAIMLAHRDGPDPRKTGAPGDSNCTESGCHTRGGPPTQGGIEIDFPDGLTYTPGAKQRWTIRVTGATTVNYGFQLTARPMNDSRFAQAGDFAAVDSQVFILCEDNRTKQAGQACPSSTPLQFAEHTQPNPKNTFSVDWTAPASDVGPIGVWVAANAAGQSVTPGTPNPTDRIFLTNFTLTLAASGPAPAVQQGSVLNAASNALSQPVAPGSLVSIYGTDLAGALAEAKTVPLPTTLNDVSVTFNNIAAPLLFVAGGQINAQIPWNVLDGTSSSQATMVVTRGGVKSSPVTVPVASFGPGIFPLGTRAVAYNHDTGRIAAPPGSIAGLTTAPIPIGGVLEILATGVGPIDKPVANGANSLDTLRTNTNPPTVSIGGKAAQLLFSGLSPQFVGVNQLDVVVADGTPIGDAVPIQISAGGVTSTDKITIAVSPK